MWAYNPNKDPKHWNELSQAYCFSFHVLFSDLLLSSIFQTYNSHKTLSQHPSNLVKASCREGFHSFGTHVPKLMVPNRSVNFIHCCMKRGLCIGHAQVKCAHLVSFCNHQRSFGDLSLILTHCSVASFII